MLKIDFSYHFENTKFCLANFPRHLLIKDWRSTQGIYQSKTEDLLGKNNFPQSMISRSLYQAISPSKIEEFHTTLVHPQVLFRNWSDEILDCFHVLMLKLSFTRDMAKYLGFTLCRGGALYPQALVSQDKIFQKLSLRPTWTRSNLSITTTHCPCG